MPDAKPPASTTPQPPRPAGPARRPGTGSARPADPFG